MEQHGIKLLLRQQCQYNCAQADHRRLSHQADGNIVVRPCQQKHRPCPAGFLGSFFCDLIKAGRVLLRKNIPHVLKHGLRGAQRKLLERKLNQKYRNQDCHSTPRTAAAKSQHQSHDQQNQRIPIGCPANMP